MSPRTRTTANAATAFPVIRRAPPKTAPSDDIYITFVFDGACTICGMECEHVRWKDGICTICGFGCAHEWQDGVCINCGMSCPHRHHDAQTGVCSDCGMKVPHSYHNGICTRCGEKPVFVTSPKEMPEELSVATDRKGRLDTYHFPLEEGDIVPGAHPTGTPEERSMRDMIVYTPYGYDETKQYNVVILAPAAGHTVHQWMEKATLLSGAYGRVIGSELLDRMIAAEFVEPVIVVAVEYYLRDAPASVAVGYERDLRERVLPFVAENYATYASVDGNGDLIAAPEHFGYVAASYGSMVGWQMLPNCTDLFAFWGLLSGGYLNDEEITMRINAGVSAQDPIHYLYTGEGKLALGWGSYKYRMERLDEDCAYIKSGENFTFLAIDRAGHNYPSWNAGLFNCLRIFFLNRFVPLSSEPASVGNQIS